MSEELDADEIKGSIPMDVVLEMLELEPPDRSGKICCPFHEEQTGSLHVYEDGYFCYGCGRGGDIFHFVMGFGHSFVTALKFLGGVMEDLDCQPGSVHRTPEEKVVLDLTEEFNDSTDSLDWVPLAQEYVDAKPWPSPSFLTDVFGVRSDGKTLWIPHYDALGSAVVGVKIRTFNDDKFALKGSNYRTSLYQYAGTSRKAAAPPPVAVICEGESDTWVATEQAFRSDDWWDSFGLPSGALYWSDEWDQQLDGYDRIVVATDNDSTGRKAAKAIQERLGDRTVRLTPPGGDLVDSIASGWDMTQAIEAL